MELPNNVFSDNNGVFVGIANNVLFFSNTVFSWKYPVLLTGRKTPTYLLTYPVLSERWSSVGYITTGSVKRGFSKVSLAN